MKNFKKLSAFLTALTICSSMTVGTVSNAVVFADETVIQPGSEEVVDMYDIDWVPKNFNDALEFYNTHGKTYIKETPEGSIICTVFLLDNSYTYQTNYDSGCYNVIAGDVYESETADFRIAVTAYLASEGTMNISHIGKYNDNIVDQTELSFETAADGTVTEKDWFSFIPDCETEFDAFIEQYGKVSIHGKYVVYCDIVGYSAGMDIDFSQTGEGKLDQVFESTASEQTAEPIAPGTPSKEIRVYCPSHSGNVTATWLNSQLWDPDCEFGTAEIRNFVIDENLDITMADDITESVPSWIPRNFEDALKFDNRYGRTHVFGEYICTVQKKDAWVDDGTEYATEDAGSTVNMNDCVVFQKTYDFTWPEEPVPSDYATDEEYMEAHYNYINKLSELGVSQSYKEYFEHCYFNYEVTVYRVTEPGTLSFNWLYMNPQTNVVYDQDNFSFERSEDGTVTETDYYGWLPDCVEEFDNFRIKHGTTSVQNGYIVYCDDVCYDGGFDIALTQSGNGAVESVLDYNVSKTLVEPLDGGMGCTIKLYKPTASGNITMDWLNSQLWDPDCEDATHVIQNYTISDDMQITADSNIGDCNLNGSMGIEDAVAMKKWLLSRNNDVLCSNADLNNDGKINVFDFTILKRWLKNRQGLMETQQIEYTVLTNEWVTGLSIEESRGFIANTKEEFTAVIDENEKDDYTYNSDNVNALIENVTDSLFEEKSAIILYIPSGGSNRNVTIEDTLTKVNDTIIVNTEVYEPINATPDMQYKRIVLLIDKADAENVTNISHIYTSIHPIIWPETE